VTDKPALLLHNVDREALLTRIAHCSAYQLLVAGVFNGKDLGVMHGVSSCCVRRL
jgi:hypothetical protein